MLSATSKVMRPKSRKRETLVCIQNTAMRHTVDAHTGDVQRKRERLVLMKIPRCDTDGNDHNFRATRTVKESDRNFKAIQTERHRKTQKDRGECR